MTLDIPPGPFRWPAPSTRLTKWQLCEALRAHVVRRVLRSVYVRTSVPDTIELRAACARLALPDHVVVCDHSAAWLLGIDTFDVVVGDDPPVLEVVSMAGHQPTRRPGVLGGKRDLLPDEVCRVCGVLTTTALRTACDLACLRGRHSALAVLDLFMRHHGLTRDDYRRMLPRFKGRRGVKQLRELIAYATPKSESPGESWTRMVVIDEGLPMPEPQVEVEVPGFGLVRLDLAYASLMIAIEYDGEQFHTEEADRERDEARRAALRRAGWVVIVVTKDGFTGMQRDAWVAQLHGARRERSPRVGRRTYSRGADVMTGVRRTSRRNKAHFAGQRRSS